MRHVQLTGTAIIIGVIVSLPALSDAFLGNALDVRSALIRFAVAVVLATVGIAVLRAVVEHFRVQNAIERHKAEDDSPKRRHQDAEHRA